MGYESEFSRVANEMARRTTALVDKLCAAFAQSHDIMGTVSRYDAAGRGCIYPVSETWGDEISAQLLNATSSLADEYRVFCPLPPEECMVVSWIDGLTIRVEYERLPPEWRTKENAAQPVKG